MNEKTILVTASIGLALGVLFGMAGSIASSASIRVLAWGIDAIALILASVILAIYYFRKESNSTAAGFLVFAIGECFILFSSGTNLDEHIFYFGIGTGLWAAALLIISSQKTYPPIVRLSGLLTAVLFSVVSFLILTGHDINALSKPLPFYAYPIFVLTIFGWAWSIVRKPSHSSHEKM